MGTRMQLSSSTTLYSEMLLLRPDIMCGLLLWQQGCSLVCHCFRRGCLCLTGDATEKLMKEKHVHKVEKVEKIPPFSRVNIIHTLCYTYVGLIVAALNG